MNAPALWWKAYAADETSQGGEDGVLRRVLEILPPAAPEGRKCVEFGAWDGKKYSNTWRLIAKEGYGAVLIEADPARFRELQATYAGRADVACVRRFVEFDGPNALGPILKEAGLPPAFDLLSIDIDGNDYHIWDSLRGFEPRVVIIEFNETIPNHVEFIQPRDMGVNQGSSFLSMLKLGRSKGYEPVAATATNLIFVRAADYPLFGLADNSPDALRPDRTNQMAIFQLYDGTIVVEGCRKLLWEGKYTAFGSRHFQILPAPFRFFERSGAMFLWRLKRLYLRWFQWKAKRRGLD